MKAVTVEVGTAGSVRLEDVPEPAAALGSVVVEALAAGICGTDGEIASGSYGWPPPGRDRLILGHESLGRVVDPGPRQPGRAGGDRVAVSSGGRRQQRQIVHAASWPASTWWASSAAPTRHRARTAPSA